MENKGLHLRAELAESRAKLAESRAKTEQESSARAVLALELKEKKDKEKEQEDALQDIQRTQQLAALRRVESSVKEFNDYAARAAGPGSFLEQAKKLTLDYRRGLTEHAEEPAAADLERLLHVFEYVGIGLRAASNTESQPYEIDFARAGFAIAARASQKDSRIIYFAQQAAAHAQRGGDLLRGLRDDAAKREANRQAALELYRLGLPYGRRAASQASANFSDCFALAKLLRSLARLDELLGQRAAAIADWQECGQMLLKCKDFKGEDASAFDGILADYLEEADRKPKALSDLQAAAQSPP